MLFLTGCKTVSYTPVICTDFDLNAVYQTGDFSYSCKIKRDKKGVKVTVLSTSARGMTITYDGQNVTFSYHKMTKSIDGESIDKTNPAIVLYQVFSAFDNINNIKCEKVKNGFQYIGKTSIGDFVLIQDKSNNFKNISIPSQNISVKILN